MCAVLVHSLHKENPAEMYLSKGKVQGRVWEAKGTCLLLCPCYIPLLHT